MTNNEVNLKPGGSVTLTLDQSSLSDVHGKGDAALAATRAHDQHLEAHDQALVKHAGLIRELGKVKAERASLEAVIGRLAELEAAVSSRVTKDEVTKLLEEVREEIRQAAGLSRLLTPAGK